MYTRLIPPANAEVLYSFALLGVLCYRSISGDGRDIADSTGCGDGHQQTVYIGEISKSHHYSWDLMPETEAPDGESHVVSFNIYIHLFPRH